MTLFLITFGIMAAVVALMAVGAVFGRTAIKGSCGGANNGECICLTKCEKRRKLKAEGEGLNPVDGNP